ncbi:MAG: response regulator transcription factor [Deltaproteobacteria bacterium]|nr:response regulator transcription factor [Deltaproteobacteria bacterium]MBW1906656.1 response regulator transcription factor [Deltaproteobacteria bacterium]MBW2161295.1 response regulator transcription factor [Deltaproteobacteria bacterium]MBW2381105.1 response regulator transcription factor [Deltaproteobacteria bacterium]MBW2687443.1 response regulator transcription factor [Deltaproteobacteria bacterium]
MDHVGSAIIDFTEAAYDLELSDEEWLPTILKRGLPVLEQGLGVAGMRYGRPPNGGPFQILDIHVASGPKDFAERHTRALALTPPEVLREQVRPGRAGTVSGEDDVSLEQLAHYTSHVDYCKDVLTITAVDRTGSGVAIVAPLPEVTKLTGHDAQRWEMLAAHLDAGHRLRQGLSALEAGEQPCPDLPHDAEAIFDANTFRLTEAVGPAKHRTSARKLRDAAVTVDRARGKMRDTDPEKALQIWKALVRGRWSMVDWFDTDDRRFVLALPNAPDVSDPRGLSEREGQVVAYAVLGQANKMIAYRLGLSRSRVSMLLRAAMRKLDVQTRTQLVLKMRDFEALQ